MKRAAWSVIAVLALGGCAGPGGGSAPARSAAFEPAPAPQTAVEGDSDERPGLGTLFGEQLSSPVVHRAFERASAAPFAEVALHYGDERGVIEQARFRGAELEPIRVATPRGGIAVTVIDERGLALPGAMSGGRVFVVGRDGQRYRIAIENETGGRYEVVGSVDGLDVIDGRPASPTRRGYVLAPHATLVIDGFRTSADEVAAFRFGSVAASYAARSGSDRNVGVIGLAFFSEAGSPWTTDELRRREAADPFPARYAAPPR